MLALLALLCQSLLLPLPAMAMPASSLPPDAALFAGGYVLCQDDDGTAPASDHDKAPCPHCTDCLLCQAVYHGGSLVPPAPPVLPAPSEQAITVRPEPAQNAPRRIAAAAHRARGPPSIPSL